MIEKKQSYKYQVYEKIKEDIITGVYLQGQVFNERKLSESLGISRTPVREALQMLNIDGWIVEEPYKGSVVRTFDIDYVMNVQKVRQVLEILAIEDTISNIDDRCIEELERIINRQEQSLTNYDSTEFMELDRELHEKIYSFSKNDVLLKLLSNLNDIIRYFGIKVLTVPERSKLTFEEHKVIVDAIKRRDLNLAKKAMEKHMTMTTQAIYKYTMESKNVSLDAINNKKTEK